VRLLLIVLVVAGVIAVLALRVAATGRTSRRDPGQQPQVIDPDPSPAGSDRPATRPDGESIPGSEEDRHRHGKP
jgi:hypothetical protein